MMKIDKEIKKRWLAFSALNAVALIIIYGVIMGVFGYYVVNSNKSQLENGILAYEKVLKKYSFEDIQNNISSGVEINKELQNPNFPYVLFSKRGDGSYGVTTFDSFLKNKSLIISGKLNQIAEEELEQFNFLTYTFAMDNEGNYVKIYVPFDYNLSMTSYFKTYGAIFLAIFLVCTVIISLAVGYIEIKPIMESYIKQKNFVNDMSHEIRTPLAVIRGNLENIICCENSTVQEVSEMLNDCIDSVDYMTDMATGLLGIVRVENKMSKKDTTLSEVVSEVADIYSEMIAMGNKSLIACIETCDIVVDREKIKQLLDILIENSIKYTREGDKIEVKLKNTKEGCLLSVADTGIGVSNNDYEQIFDRFYRAENAKEYSGTGLGLSIAKSVVDGMNGKIRATKNIPNGLKILVSLKRD